MRNRVWNDKKENDDDTDADGEMRWWIVSGLFDREVLPVYGTVQASTVQYKIRCSVIVVEVEVEVSTTFKWLNIRVIRHVHLSREIVADLFFHLAFRGKYPLARL